LRYAVERIPEDFEIFAFVDSDCLLRPQWLSSLAEALMQNPAGAVTGYRWFIPPIQDFAANLRAVWNAGVFVLFDESGRYNFAWGGSMAILRKTFFNAHVLDYWSGSVSDDLGLMNAVRSTGQRIRFVPAAIPLTGGKITLAEFFSWASRQFLMARIYYRGLFRTAFIYHTAWVLWVAIGVLFYPKWFLPLFLVTLVAQMVKAELRLNCASMVFPGIHVGNRLYHWLFSPIIAVCNFLMLSRLLFTRKTKWRGIKYTLIGPNELRIERSYGQE
jgi:cellulose synthase/poly-beta-1,6-N-acetylglucosamine synthase-like glycosyltransferase